jgi:hypothetical protein
MRNDLFVWGAAGAAPTFWRLSVSPGAEILAKRANVSFPAEERPIRDDRSAQIAVMSGQRPVVKGRFEGAVNVSGCCERLGSGHVFGLT